MPHRSYLLEATPASFVARPFSRRGVGLVQADGRAPARCAALWLGVGLGFWTARTRWSTTRWREHLGRDAVAFWVASRGADDIGFFELIVQRRGVKLEGFGLLAPWRGLGLGAGLLSAATREAFRLGATRVWLHTATDDHPAALPNYLAGGYRVYRERELKHPMPAASLPAR
jgi:GNAT superfamily N-acetyltransferase